MHLVGVTYIHLYFLINPLISFQHVSQDVKNTKKWAAVNVPGALKFSACCTVPLKMELRKLMG